MLRPLTICAAAGVIYSLDANSLCIVCNWFTSPWGSLLAGAFGAVGGAIGALMGGGYGTGPFKAGSAPPAHALGDPEYGLPQGPRPYPNYGRPGWPGGPRPDWARYGDNDGNPYWPGWSPIPKDGVVYHRYDARTGIPVDPKSGMPKISEGGDVAKTTLSWGGARG